MLADNNSGVIAISAGVFYNSFFCIFAVGVYLFTDECILSYIYLMMACGKWFSFKRGCGNFHLSQMSFYCDENICEFLVTFTSQR